MKKLLLALCVLFATQVSASEIFTKNINMPIDQYLKKLKNAITANHMHVIYEMDLIEKFKEQGFEKKFGKNFNRNKLDSVKTLLLCNGYVGNQVSNIDPHMMALCPIRLTIIGQGKTTTVVFIKSSSVAKEGRIKDLLNTLDTILIHTIDLTVDDYMQEAHRIGGYDDQFSGN